MTLQQELTLGQFTSKFTLLEYALLHFGRHASSSRAVKLGLQRKVTCRQQAVTESKNYSNMKCSSGTTSQCV